jgi:hypothetical protein
MSLMMQMANVGADVGRALKWHAKGEETHFQNALERALALFSLTASDPKLHGTRLREVLRSREVFLDYLFGGNQYQSTPESFDRYFMPFGVAANKERQAQRASA